MNTGTAGTGTDFHTGTGHFGKFGKTSIPVPDTSVSSVRHQIPEVHIPVPGVPVWTSVCIQVGTGIGKTSTPVPVWTSAPKLLPVSVKHRHRYRTVR